MEFTLNINLNGNTDLEKAKNSLSNTTGKDTELESKSTDEALNKAKKKDNSMTAGVLAFEIGKEAVQQISSYAISSYGTKHGDIATQNKLNNAITVGTQVAKAGVLAATGNWALLALDAVSQGIQMFQRYDEYKDIERERTVNEVRQSERIGRVASDRNRGA